MLYKLLTVCLVPGVIFLTRRLFEPGHYFVNLRYVLFVCFTDLDMYNKAVMMAEQFPEHYVTKDSPQFSAAS